MANYRPVYTTIWNDIVFEKYTQDQMLLYLYLITNKESLISGIYKITPKSFSTSINCSIDAGIEIIKSFPENKVRYDFIKGIVYVSNFYFYNKGVIKNKTIAKSSLLRNIELVPCDFWELFFEKYKDDDVVRTLYDSSIEPEEIVEEPFKVKENEKIDYDFFVNIWNAKMPKKVLKLNIERKRKLKARMSNDNDFKINFEKCLDRILESNFLSGRKTNWSASFDWLITNQTNYMKVLEGNYENNNPEPKNLQMVKDFLNG